MNHFARTTGQSFSKVWQDFGRNAEHYMDMVDSSRMVRTTMLMQARARSLNMTTSALAGVLDKFETMDQAQETGAKLNTILTTLGGSFDAVKASSMDYAERQEYIGKTLRSVFPRIQAAGPRAARLYMRSIRTTLGMEAKDLQAMMHAQPGSELAGITAMARGAPMGAMGAKAENKAAAAATKLTDKVQSALTEALPAAFALAWGKTGIAEMPRATRSLSEKVGTLGSAIGNLSTTGLGHGAEQLKKAFPPQWLSDMDNMFGENGKMDRMFERIDDFNAKQRAGTETYASSMAQMHHMMLELSTRLAHSDRRLKSDIKAVYPSKYASLGLRHVSWRWNELAKPAGHTGRAEGVIAQEVQKLYPNAVVWDSDGYLMVDYGQLDILRSSANECFSGQWL
jgi:hypothetical protein